MGKDVDGGLGDFVFIEVIVAESWKLCLVLALSVERLIFMTEDAVGEPPSPFPERSRGIRSVLSCIQGPKSVIYIRVII